MAKQEKANVRLAAEADALGAGPVTVGIEIITTLPDVETQRRGFYCEKAEQLITLYRGRYKMIERKGEK